jgi:hypothetical protein
VLYGLPRFPTCSSSALASSTPPYEVGESPGAVDRQPHVFRDTTADPQGGVVRCRSSPQCSKRHAARLADFLPVARTDDHVDAARGGSLERRGELALRAVRDVGARTARKRVVGGGRRFRWKPGATRIVHHDYVQRARESPVQRHGLTEDVGRPIVRAGDTYDSPLSSSSISQLATSSSTTNTRPIAIADSVEGPEARMSPRAPTGQGDAPPRGLSRCRHSTGPRTRAILAPNYEGCDRSGRRIVDGRAAIPTGTPPGGVVCIVTRSPSRL